MERQYIGARYVPKFADPVEWQEGATYEALTIVTYMGASYTSKKAVPAGVKPTDSSYWVVTGNYNAQVEEFRQLAVKAFEDVEGLKEDFNNKTGKDIIFIGDSYGDNPRVDNTWGSVCASAMGLGADKWHNLCVSGSAFSAAGRGHYIDQLVRYTGNRKSVTDIVLLAGVNDWGTGRLDIFNAASELIVYIRANYPNAKAHVGYIGISTGSSMTAYASEVYHAYNSLGFLGFCVIPNAIACNHNYDLLEDGAYHPNALANNIIGWALASYLSGGAFSYNNPESVPGSFVAEEGFNVVEAGITTTVDQASATVRVNINRLLMTITTPEVWANDQSHIIGTLTSPVFRSGNRIGQRAVNFAYSDAEGYKVGYGVLGFNHEGKVYLHTLGVFTPGVIVISGTFDVELIDC